MNKQTWLQVLSAYFGWLMDGYTTIAYALVATTIAPLFFPSNIGVLALIATFGGFAVEALARPIGALVFGNYLGDKLGRRNMLVITILGFSILAGSKGLLPTYSVIGIFAPIILYIILFFEGMFAGAEYGGGTTLSMESVPAKYRSPIGAFVQSGFGTGYFIVSFVFAALYEFYGASGFSTIGWRVLFYTTFIPGIITLIIRYITKETDVFEKMKEKKEIMKIPLAGLIKKGGRPLIFALMFTTGLLFINTITFSFYPSIFFLTQPGISGATVGTYVALINLVSLFGVWFGGLLAMLIPGRRLTIIIYTIIFIILTYPIAYFAFTGSAEQKFIMFSIQAFFEAMIFATLPAFLAETFSKTFRATGVGFAYNGGAIVGGFGISIVLSTEALFRSLFISWTVWLFIMSILALISMILSRETWKRGMPDAIEA